MIFKRNNLSSCFPFTGFISFSKFSFDTLCRSDYGLLHYCESNIFDINRSANWNLKIIHDVKISLHWKDSSKSSCLDRKENAQTH